MAKGKKALGRLIDSIIPRDEGVRDIFMCPVDEIKPNPKQPRKRFNEDSLKALSESIKTTGVLQPICLRKTDDGYQIVFGERRWRAAIMAGLERIPAVVLQGDEENTLKLSIIENILREELSPLEVAEAFKLLNRELGMSHEEIGRLLGLDRSTVTNTIRLLSLPEEIKDMLEENLITPGHARALLPMEDKELMVKYARMVVEKGLSVRQLEDMIRRDKKPRRVERPFLKEDEMNMIELVEKDLGIKVRVKGKPEKPKLELALKSREELTKILKLLRNLL